MTSRERRTRALAQIAPFIERARTFSGWNFDDLKVRPVEDPPDGRARQEPWDYVALARSHAARAGTVVDLGTGGGEVYARIVDGISARFLASEEWHVNAPVARERLRPLGVEVIHASSERTPWAAETFGLMLSRHEAIQPPEIARVLRPGGVFLTQQVAKEQWQELSAFFPDRAVFPDHIVEYRRAFEEEGMRVRVEHHAWRAVYATLGEVAFMLLVAPWDIPGFDPIRDIDRLLALEDAHGGDDGIVLTIARYLMEAVKAANEP
jgi:SAM-dependent methyltransferase